MKKINIGISQINNSFSGAHYLPYAAGLLEGHVRAHARSPAGYEFLEPLFRRIPVEEAVNQFKDADVVGFSLYAWNIKLSLCILRELKRINPNILIICGGPQVPDRAEEFLQENPFIDLAAHGEGEAVFVDILDCLENGAVHEAGGISYRDENGIFCTNPKPDRIRDLEEIESPYLSGMFDPLIAAYKDIEWLALWETNRGCPFKCTFCDWGSATQAKVFQFGMDRLKAELDWFSQNKIEFIFCCDANFGILKRDVEIAGYAALNKERYGYPHALSVQNTKNATERAYLTQKILADAGLNKGVTLSMQSLDEVTLANIKRENIALDTYEVLQKRFTADGVPTYSDLILGLPGETYETFVEGISRLIENGQHNRIQFNNLSILPNAEMGDPEYQKKFGMSLVETKILNMHGTASEEVEEIAETQYLVVSTASMPPEDWQKTRAICWMTAFLHFDKILQVPMILMHEITGMQYRDLIESFMTAAAADYPLITRIREYFIDRARVIQEGGPEYEFSEKWLGIWWPHDEFILIQLAVNGEIDQFYDEALTLFSNLAQECSAENHLQILQDAIRLNRALLKLPFHADDIDIELGYNLLAFYHGVLHGTPVTLEQTPHTYRIARAAEHWKDWETWCKEVVWFANKKGAYLYGSEALTKYYAGHY